MQENVLFKTIPEDKFKLFKREDLEVFAREEQRIRISLQKELDQIKSEQNEFKQRTMLLEEKYITIKNRYFGKSSEKSPKKESSDKKDPITRKKQVKLPRLRYPDAPLIEKDIILDVMPTCSCCNEQMKDSGMTEDSEYLTAFPRQFFVVRQKRHKYTCGKCHGDLITAPILPRIKQGSSYSDEMIIDVALSKYCDLIPIERYKMMALEVE